MLNTYPLIKIVGLLHILFAGSVFWIWSVDDYNINLAPFYLLAIFLFLLLGIFITLLKIRIRKVYYILPTILCLIELNAILTTFLFGLVTSLLRETIYQGVLVVSIVFILYVINQSKEKQFLNPSTRKK